MSGPSATVITHLPPKLFGPHDVKREMLQIERWLRFLCILLQSIPMNRAKSSESCSSRILLAHSALYVHTCGPPPPPPPLPHSAIASALHPLDYEPSRLPAAWCLQQWPRRQAQAKVFSLSCFLVAAAEDLRLSFRASERHVGDIDKCIWEQRDDDDYVYTHTKIKEIHIIHIKKLWRNVPTA